MNAKEIIQLNNDLRTELNDENLKVYEDMLLYIRAKSNKSEQQTEEVLLELLNHLLEAQKEGKTAEDIFGSDYKAYCDEVINEIPVEENRKKWLFVGYIVIQFLAIISLTYGFVGFSLNYFFDLGSAVTTIALGSGLVVILIDLLLLYIVIKVVFRWIAKSTFTDEKPRKYLDFFLAWLVLTAFISLFVFIPRFIPEFGMAIDIPVITFGLVGLLLYLGSYFMNKRFRLTK